MEQKEIIVGNVPAVVLTTFEYTELKKARDRYDEQKKKNRAYNHRRYQQMKNNPAFMEKCRIAARKHAEKRRQPTRKERLERMAARIAELEAQLNGNVPAPTSTSS